LAIDEQPDEQPFHRAFVHAELAIAVILGSWRMFEPVQRRLSRQHSAVLPVRRSLARDKAEYGIVAQFIVVVQILVAKRDAIGEQRFDRVLDAVLSAAILEAGRHLAGEADDAVALPQKQCASVRRDGAAIEGRCDFPSAKAGKIEGILNTLCLHRGHPLLQLKSLSQKNFR
jgi:hypothetical protein